MAKLKSLSDTEIKNKIKSYHLPGTFLGVFSKDELSKFSNNSYAVINIENSTDDKGNPLPGTHWVCAGIKNNQSWYFDSFGLPPPMEVRKAMSKTDLIWFDKEIQGIYSEACGEFCIVWIRFLYSHDESVKSCYKDFTSMLDEPILENNDKIIKNLL